MLLDDTSMRCNAGTHTENRLFHWTDIQWLNNQAVMPAQNIYTGSMPFELNAMDRRILAQTDEEFHLQTWDELKRIIGP